tara:strand:- start:94 stop:465 length:372 start_codon:yes stop_codon:yes gene_type:complete
MNKLEDAYLTIGEVVRLLDLKSKKGEKLPTHTLRYWEKEFTQIKPLILKGNRRYYDKKNVEILKKIKFLLKHQGMTINGVKKILKNKNSFELDELKNNSIRTVNLKNKLIKISKLAKSLKNIK